MTLYQFYEKYLLLNLSDYENIGIDLQINLVLLALSVGIIIAIITTAYSRATMQTVIKNLYRHEANSEESAKTLKALSLYEKRYIRALENSSQLSKMVARVGEREIGYEEYISLQKSKKDKSKQDKSVGSDIEVDYSMAKFYLRKSGLDRSKHVLDGYETSVLSTILSSLFIVAIYICLMFFMPSILEFINGIL